MARHRQLGFVAIITVAALILGACGGGPAEPGAGTGELSGTVKFYKGPFGPTEVEDQNTLGSKFTAEVPGVKIVFETFDWPTQEAQITQGFASGTYDLVYVPEGMYPKFAHGEGPIEDLSWCIEDPAWKEGRDNVTYWDDAKGPDGVTYGIPNVWIPESHFVANVDMLKEAGVPDDWYTTMEGVRQAALAVKEKFPGTFGIGWRTAGLKDLAQHDWYGYIIRSGAAYLSDDFKTCGLNKPELVETFQWMVDLMHEDQVTPPFGAYTWEGLRGLFQAGKLAITHDEPPIVGVLESNPPDFTYKFYPIPGIVNNNQFTFRGFYTIPKSSQNKEAACAYAKFLVRPENEVWYLNRTAGLYPALNDLKGQSLFADRNPALAEGMSLGPLAEGPQLHPQYLEFQNLVAPLWDQMMQQEITPQEMIDQSCELIEARLQP